MSDVGFVIAGYGVILGGSALYAALLLRRLARAREVVARVRRELDDTAHSAPGAPE